MLSVLPPIIEVPLQLLDVEPAALFSVECFALTGSCLIAVLAICGVSREARMARLHASWVRGAIVEGGNIDEGDTLAIGEQRFGA
jgi:uncharacterized membrane protein (DUF441 family)